MHDRSLVLQTVIVVEFSPVAAHVSPQERRRSLSQLKEGGRPDCRIAATTTSPLQVTSKKLDHSR